MAEITAEDEVLKINQELAKIEDLEGQETKSPEFVKACDRAGIPPSDRQWRKWKRGVGVAFKQGSACKEETSSS